jgi:uncharacterized membrane protein
MCVRGVRGSVCMISGLLQATDNVLKHTHLLSSQETVNPYLSAMGESQPQYWELCAEISADSQRWSVDAGGDAGAGTGATLGGGGGGGGNAEEPSTPPPPPNSYDDPD